jgi:hypothetical protein
MWVATKDPDAVRTTKGVDILLRRSDLARAKRAAKSADLEYFEVLGVGMFLDHKNPHPKRGVHIIWAGEKVKPEYPLPAPDVDDRLELQPGRFVVSLIDLVKMKLMARRLHDLTQLKDMIDVGLIDREMLRQLPKVLAERLEPLFAEQT